MYSTGVDGCRAGWFAVSLSDEGVQDRAVCASFSDLMERCGEASVILIDIPIGLPDTEPRLCDTLARRILGGKASSSVFPVPCREAVYADDYQEANRINRRVLGRGVSMQTWNICGRIREVDEYLCTGRHTGPRIRESHPELCFRSMQGSARISHSKKRTEGVLQRLEILQTHHSGSERLYRSALDAHGRKDLRPDDILDALVLAVVAHLFQGRLVSIPTEDQTDAFGLPMEIVYPNTLTSASY
jgi:predicted RNase H-like nuclease